MSETNYDAVIVGSGFGGSVMAYRLAKEGLRVCVLERKSVPAERIPPLPLRSGQELLGSQQGHVRDVQCLVIQRVGGARLQRPRWRFAHLREHPHSQGRKMVQGRPPERRLQRMAGGPRRPRLHYEAVEKMNVQKYPRNHPPYDATPKTLAIKVAAQKLNPGQRAGLEWVPLNLAVSFRGKPVDHPDDDDPNNPPLVGATIEEEYENYHSVTLGRKMPRSTCRLCGECDLGCNYGSKNTLDYNYITAAIHQPRPADIRTLCEVKRFEPLDGRGYAVYYVLHDLEREGKKTDTSTLEQTRITCKRLVLAAGTFGTPFLLMKNGAALPLLSKRLGSRYCVNGDLLSFIIKSIEKKNGKDPPRRLDPSFGPVITSAIRFGDTLDEQGPQGRGFYVEDGGNPYLVSWLTEISGFPSFLSRTFQFLKIIAKYRLGLRNDADLGAEISDLIGPSNSSKSSMPVLTMGRDVPNARLFLKDGRLECDWNLESSQEYYDRIRRSVKAITRALNAEYMDNPSYAWNFHQVLTAHPLGGCPMAETADEGVVDSHGETFGQPGLYIVDGSVMPGPVGPNPSLTIAAFADRSADHIIAQHKGEKS